MDAEEALIRSMTELNEPGVTEAVQQMLQDGRTNDSIMACLNTGLENVGQLFEKGEYFIADLIVSGMIYRSALSRLQPVQNGSAGSAQGRIVIGVVEGDIHDIGKDIIASVLRAEHFDVVDLGIDVKPEHFCRAVEKYRPDVLLMSGVLTTAAESMERTMQALRSKDLLRSVPVLIGGRCASEALMRRIGADGWAYDTMETLRFCEETVKAKYGTGN